MYLTIRYGWVDSISDARHSFLGEDVVVSAEELSILWQKHKHICFRLLNSTCFTIGKDTILKLP